MIFDPATHTVHVAGRSWQADPAHTSIQDHEGGEGFDGRRFLHRDRRCLVRFRMRRHTDDDGYEWHDLEAYLDDTQLTELLDHLASLPTDDDYGQPPPTKDELRSAYDKVADAMRQRGEDVPPWPG